MVCSLVIVPPNFLSRFYHTVGTCKINHSQTNISNTNPVLTPPNLWNEHNLILFNRWSQGFTPDCLQSQTKGKRNSKEEENTYDNKEVSILPR